MTEERSNIDTDGVSDPLVSRTYRESAAERTPEKLDRAVLRQASREAGSRYSRSVLWLRPMAWATTIALSLAIVVELSDLPQSDSSLITMPASPDEAIGVKGEMEAVEETEALEDVETAEEAARYEPEQLEQRARKTIDEDGRVNLQSVPQLSKTALDEAVNTPATAFAPARATEEDPIAKQQFADTDSLKLNDSPIVEEADAMAQMREGKDKEADGKTSTISTLGLVSAAAVAMPCDDEARETPESWLECIELLEENGLDDLASQQREQLQEAFPDFPLP